MNIRFTSALLIVFVIFKGTHSWCSECPDATSDNSTTLCNCENAYYDQSTRECVTYFECSTFKNLLNSEIVNSLLFASDVIVSALVTEAADYFAENNLNMFTPNLTTVISVFPIQLLGEDIAEQVFNVTEDIDFLIHMARQRFLDVNHKLAADISPMLNPYVLGNKKLLKECNNLTMCVVQKVILKDQKRLVSVIAPMLSQYVDQILLYFDDIRNYFSNKCKSGECTLIKIAMHGLDLITDELIDIKQITDELGKYIVESVMHSRPLGNEIFNILLSTINTNKFW